MLFLAGCVLWALVFAGLGIVWWMKASQSASSNPKQERAIVLDEESEEPRTKKVTFDENGQAQVDVGSPWDPEGLPDFELTERSGETITKQDLLGRPTVVGFIFTRCAATCPRVTAAMRELQQQTLDLDVRFVSITVNPGFDDPARLRQYAEIHLYGADADRWWFLTGDRQDVYDLVTKHFQMPLMRKAEDDFNHTNNVLLVDAEGVVREKYNSLAPEEMVKLRRRLEEMAEPYEEPDVETSASSEPPTGGGSFGVDQTPGVSHVVAASFPEVARYDRAGLALRTRHRVFSSQRPGEEQD